MKYSQLSNRSKTAKINTSSRKSQTHYQTHTPVFSEAVYVFYASLQRIKQFLLLSKRRSALITQCLIDSETSKPNFMPRLYINRRLAMEHRDNPSLDPSCKNTVFTQVHAGLPRFLCHLSIAEVKHFYSILTVSVGGGCMVLISFYPFPLFQVFEGLKPSDKFEKTLDYRLDIFTSSSKARVEAIS